MLLMRYTPQRLAPYSSLHRPFIDKQIGAESIENHQLGDILVPDILGHQIYGTDTELETSLEISLTSAKK